MIFVDEVSVRVVSGGGGKGCESYFHRTDHKMVPNGGDGGKGGDVILRADRNVSSLYSFVLNKHYQAENGSQGSSNQKTGRDGKPLVIRVPCGTKVYNSKEHLLIRDLVADGTEVIVLRGGKGGTGNAHQGRQATPGQPAQTLIIQLSIQILADIFLVGNPNSGKSSLLTCLTHSKAKCECYPFSTRSPQLGIYQSDDSPHMTMCELPALIHGSSKGKGLGNHFLKHLERARLIFLMLDPAKEGFDPKTDYNHLLEEVRLFNAQYALAPHFVVVSKADDPQVKEFFKKKKIRFKVPFFLISTQTKEGVEKLMKKAAEFLANDTPGKEI